jgi:hypothetical protein
MSYDSDIDEFDVAVACRNTPRGAAVLERFAPRDLRKFGPVLEQSEENWVGFCAAVGVTPGEAADLWYWFHPEQADTDEYHVLREEAGHE